MGENRWPDAEHALRYLRIADTVPHRTEGEGVLLTLLPERPARVLDLGCGDGRLISLVRARHPGVPGVALDFSETMLAKARARFADEPDVTIVAHDLDDPLPDLGTFDAVVSSFAIHHLVDERKRSLIDEVAGVLRPGGVFANLEHVASPTDRLHRAFLDEMGTDPAEEDPSNKLAPVDAQLGWLRDAGFVDVDCLWKWRELALLTGTLRAVVDGGLGA